MASSLVKCTNPGCRDRRYNSRTGHLEAPPAEGTPSVCPRCKGVVARCRHCGGARFAARLMREHIEPRPPLSEWWQQFNAIPDLKDCHPAGKGTS